MAFDDAKQVGTQRCQWRCIGRRRGFGCRSLSGLGLPFEQRLAGLDAVAGSDEHAQDARIGRREQLVLHLHRFEDEEALAAPHHIAGCHRDLDHRRRHRRLDPLPAFLHRCLPRWRRL